MTDNLPNLDREHFHALDYEQLADQGEPSHPPRILMLYGSLRERSYSRLMIEEASLVLRAMGAEVRIFSPAGLPLVDEAPDTHPRVQELRKLSL